MLRRAWWQPRLGAADAPPPTHLPPLRSRLTPAPLPCVASRGLSGDEAAAATACDRSGRSFPCARASASLPTARIRWAALVLVRSNAPSAMSAARAAERGRRHVRSACTPRARRAGLGARAMQPVRGRRLPQGRCWAPICDALIRLPRAVPVWLSRHPMGSVPVMDVPWPGRVDAFVARAAGSRESHGPFLLLRGNTKERFCTSSA